MSAEHVTPDLKTWVQGQLKSGRTQDRVLEKMLHRGWTEETARLAIACFTADGRARRPKAARAPLKTPWVDLTDSPSVIDLGDSPVSVLGSLSKPQIVLLGGFLSHQECDALVEAARARMQRSGVQDQESGSTKIEDSRTSYGMCFKRGESELVSRIEARIATLLHWPVEHGEGMQVMKYGPGAEYKPHFDFFDPQSKGMAPALKRLGQRVGTLVMYLKEPVKGGGTVFPAVGFEAFPKKGNAVFFSYDRPEPSTLTLHGGAPVVEGEKWIATKWLREQIDRTPPVV